MDGIVAAYATSEYRAGAVKSVTDSTMALTASGGTQPIEKVKRLGYFEEFSILMSRAWKLVVREPRTTKVAFFQATFMGMLTGIIFFGLSTDQKGIRDRQGFLFFALIGNVFPSLTGSVLLFHAEKRVFNRERMGGAYRVSSYFISKSTTDMPVAVLPTFVYIGISYFMVGLVPTAEAFFKTLLMVLTVVTTGQSMGLFISAATPTVQVRLSAPTEVICPIVVLTLNLLQVGQALAPLCMILLIMFGGFYLQVNTHTRMRTRAHADVFMH